MYCLGTLKKYQIHAWKKSNGKLGLKGLSALDSSTRNQIIEWAAQNKEQIFFELGCGKSGRSGKSRQFSFQSCGKSAEKVRKKISLDLLCAWKTARPWLLEHLPQLQAKGWTRKQLFQAGRYSFPHGPWGPAWSPNWLRPGVEVSIDPDGAIRWTWTDPAGRTISQSAAPSY